MAVVPPPSLFLTFSPWSASPPKRCSLIVFANKDRWQSFSSIVSKRRNCRWVIHRLLSTSPEAKPWFYDSCVLQRLISPTGDHHSALYSTAKQHSTLTFADDTVRPCLRKQWALMQMCDNGTLFEHPCLCIAPSLWPEGRFGRIIDNSTSFVLFSRRWWQVITHGQQRV